MADQATVKTNGSAGSRPGGIPAAPAQESNGNGPGAGAVVTNVAEFGENLLTLSELQARLAVMELKQGVRTAQVGAPAILAGVVLAIASLPILLAGIAELLVSELGMKRGMALLGVAFVALAIGAAAVATAGVRLRRTFVGFPLTSEEFARNLNWVRTILRHSGRSGRRR